VNVRLACNPSRECAWQSEIAHVVFFRSYGLYFVTSFCAILLSPCSLCLRRLLLDDEGFQGENGFGRGGKRFPRAPRDDKVHDSIITERIQRERPCRTLFIRNIKVSIVDQRS
jgi:hypothetical protein